MKYIQDVVMAHKNNNVLEPFSNYKQSFLKSSYSGGNKRLKSKVHKFFSLGNTTSYKHKKFKYVNVK